MNNKLTDLNNHLFTQLERLGDNLNPEELKKEVERSKAITGIATQIVKSAQVSLSALKMMHAGDLEANAAKIIGMGEVKGYDLKDRA